MAGKVKPSPLPYQNLALLSAYVDLVAPANMPKDGRIRGRILQALMQRIKRFHPDEYNHCFGLIACIAKFEAVPDDRLPAEEKEAAIIAMLARLASDQASRRKHNKLGIRQQQTALGDYFTQEHYLNKSTASSRLAWFRTHWDALTALVDLTPCFCQDYRAALDDFRLTAAERPHELGTIRHATDFFLAFTHNLSTVSSENLRKSLRTKS
jgi:hypothetical protein